MLQQRVQWQCSVLRGFSALARTRGQGKLRSSKESLSELCSSQRSASRAIPWQLSLAFHEHSKSHQQLKIKDRSPFCFKQQQLPPYCSSPCTSRPTLAQAWWGEPLQGAQSWSKLELKIPFPGSCPNGGGGSAQGRSSIEMSSASEKPPRAGPRPAWGEGWAEGGLCCWGCQEHTKGDVHTVIFPKATTEGLSFQKLVIQGFRNNFRYLLPKCWHANNF